MIPIKNIYHMLCYAFSVLNENEYNKVGTEDFENTLELFAEILNIGIKKQIKQGLVKDYIEENEVTSLIRGKINISNSIKDQSFLKRQLYCTYDEFSINCYLNQIIKSTLNLILKNDLSKERKSKLKKILPYFREVDTLDVNKINWKIRYDRNNQNYRMIIGICYLTIKGLLQTEDRGNAKLMEFLDDQRMSRLYEKFILEYYKLEYPEIKVHSPQIKWQLDNDNSWLLPVMQTDIVLSYGDKTLIIDAKYYGNIFRKHYDVNTLHSGNLYQIFTYVKNKEIELSDKSHEVSGMLLYAKTDEKLVPNQKYTMSGNVICIKTLNLNQDFSLIKKQLDDIVHEFILEN